ncbi:hypothetical protein, partial [Sulfuracidifex tepidarius]|uniref:hypothetical protein n=1 Tax=Sulfuracidifex tepidarius TaxID=1294262 RepID=UPI001C46C928
DSLQKVIIFSPRISPIHLVKFVMKILCFSFEFSYENGSRVISLTAVGQELIPHHRAKDRP